MQVRTVHDYIADTRAFLSSGTARKGLLVTAAAVLGGTFLVAVYRAWQKSQTVRAQRLRMVSGQIRAPLASERMDLVHLISLLPSTYLLADAGPCNSRNALELPFGCSLQSE